MSEDTTGGPLNLANDHGGHAEKQTRQGAPGSGSQPLAQTTGKVANSLNGGPSQSEEADRSSNASSMDHNPPAETVGKTVADVHIQPVEKPGEPANTAIDLTEAVAATGDNPKPVAAEDEDGNGNP